MELFALLYFIFLLCVLVACAIVVFHLQRYSIDKKIATATTIAFLVGTLLLTIITTIFFLQIPFDQLT
jgi:uncharacterized membrane protein YdcZ (DUF606 family)